MKPKPGVPRIGCVPYLNAKPLIDWFHSPDCDVEAEVTYAVPSALADSLNRGELDVALVSTFELFVNPGLVIVPDVSISADGPVKSVRLFSRVEPPHIRSVALDTSSLTSTALTRILLRDSHGLFPDYVPHRPDLDAMLAACDAGLIIGDLKLFDRPGTRVLDLGGEWKRLTGLPFCYAAWLAREEADLPAVTAALTRAKAWGVARLEALTARWSREMALPEERVRDYFQNVMRYGLREPELSGLREFRRRCLAHGLIETATPLRVFPQL